MLAGPPGALAAGGSASQRAPSASDPVRLLSERNIFDASREPRRPERSAPSKPLEWIELVGVWRDGSRPVALVEGSRSQYCGSLSVGQTIADFKALRIETDGLVLSRNGSTIALPVGSRLSRRGDEEWSLSAGGLGRETADGRGPSATPQAPATPEAGSSRQTDADRPSAGSDSKTSPAPSGAANDLLKRLMERRRQETGR